MRWLAAVLSLFLVLAVGDAQAGFDEGLAAYDRGDYATALRELQPFAVQGHAEAQAILGHMYAKGQGVPQDDAEAEKWLRKAAEQGNAAAQFDLEFMYGEGAAPAGPLEDAATARIRTLLKLLGEAAYLEGLAAYDRSATPTRFVMSRKSRWSLLSNAVTPAISERHRVS